MLKSTFTDPAISLRQHQDVTKSTGLDVASHRIQVDTQPVSDLTGLQPAILGDRGAHAFQMIGK